MECRELVGIILGKEIYSQLLKVLSLMMLPSQVASGVGSLQLMIQTRLANSRGGGIYYARLLEPSLRYAGCVSSRLRMFGGWWGIVS